MDHNAATPSQGRILLCFPMETVSCGAAEAASRGFFDAEDVPPWDTWFWYAGQVILCWVPDGFISRAQAGIDANPVDCIHWAKPRDVAHLTKHE